MNRSKYRSLGIQYINDFMQKNKISNYNKVTAGNMASFYNKVT